MLGKGCQFNRREHVGERFNVMFLQEVNDHETPDLPDHSSSLATYAKLHTLLRAQLPHYPYKLARQVGRSPASYTSLMCRRNVLSVKFFKNYFLVIRQIISRKFHVSSFCVLFRLLCFLVAGILSILLQSHVIITFSYFIPLN